ncbi:phosphatidylinositol-glycan biosynthesis class S protein [Geopyxis carbonaria]|nr:phosphatidylinositol-glycan biosynthesis class S protein [Geopyxis carbonaria]
MSFNNYKNPSNQSKLSSSISRKGCFDNSSHANTRSYVIISFWIVVVGLGLPLWWITTSIYRAPLPLEEMQSWADSRACRAEFPLLVDVEAPLLFDVNQLLKSVQHALDDANDFSAHHLRLRLASKRSVTEVDVEENVAATLKLMPATSGSTHSYASFYCIDGLITNSTRYMLSNYSRIIELYYSPTYNPSSSASSTSLSVFIADTLQAIFAEEQQMISYLLSTSTPTPLPVPSLGVSSGNGTGNPGANKLNTAEITRKMSRIMRYSPTYHISFSMFTATASPTSWDIEEALDEYIQPLLEALSGISNFTIDSQIQFYASLSSSIVPNWVPDLSDVATKNGQWVLQKQDLSSFINSAEWPLVSITSYPTINFIIYIPSGNQSPLTIAESATNAFLLPQWGGVKVINFPNNQSDSHHHLSKEDLKTSMDIFAAQLLALLGAPSHPSSLPIRLDSLTRQRSAELLTSAASTLGSLYRLTLALPSISIPTSVATSVALTLESLRNVCRDLKNGNVGGYDGALSHGRNAAAQAEQAFFEKSMVGQVYFPEEHKVAVYLPLLGPVGVPLLSSAFKEIIRLIEWARQ